MSSEYKVVSPEIFLQEFVDGQMLRTGERCFFVVEAGHLLGMITPHEVRVVPPQAWPYASLREVMRPAKAIHSISRDMPAYEALESMGRKDVNQLPVISDGRVEGIVTRAHILQVLRSRKDLRLPPSLPRAA